MFYKKKKGIFMKKIAITLFLLPIFALGFNQNDLDKIYDKPIVVNNKNITINIKLPIEPSTGYIWVLEDYNYNYIKADRFYIKAENNGLNKFSNFKLKINSRFKNVPQLETLTFKYLRPWEGCDKSIYTKKIEVISTAFD